MRALSPNLDTPTTWANLKNSNRLLLCRAILPMHSLPQNVKDNRKFIGSVTWPSTTLRTCRLPSAFTTAAVPKATVSFVAAAANEAGNAVGVVIVDHGSKRKASNEMLLEFVDVYKKTTGRSNVQPAHMEIAEPSISQAVAECIAQGARTVIIAPYFLSKGRHIQDDIPALVKEAQLQHPDVECIVAAPIGVDPLMAQLIESRVTQAATAPSSVVKS